LRNGSIGLVAAILLLVCSCDSGGNGGSSGLKIALSFTPPPGGITDVAWLAGGGAAGGLLVVDIVARDISSDFDAFDVEVSFDPLIATAQSVVSGGLLESCSSTPVLKAENVSNGNANLTGSILISEAFGGGSPPACTLAGERTVARINFRAFGRGSSDLEFIGFNGDPNSPSGSRFYRRAPSVPQIPVQFFDSGAVIDVTRQ